jgi:hypothetical protein
MAAEIITKEDLNEFKLEMIAEIKQLLSKDHKQLKEWLKVNNLAITSADMLKVSSLKLTGLHSIWK